MWKKSLVGLFVGALLASMGTATVARGATIVNGTFCAKAGATTTVKVKGVSKVYSCRIDPLKPMATLTTWTLKTCVTYLAAAKNSQDSINQQRSLVQAMSEPDKTTYTKQLDASQASLDKVIAAIKTNHCKAGL
jgi:Na+/H+-dicarboxylate symporter